MMMIDREVYKHIHKHTIYQSMADIYRVEKIPLPEEVMKASDSTILEYMSVIAPRMYLLTRRLSMFAAIMSRAPPFLLAMLVTA